MKWRENPPYIWWRKNGVACAFTHCLQQALVGDYLDVKLFAYFGDIWTIFLKLRLKASEIHEICPGSLNLPINNKNHGKFDKENIMDIFFPHAFEVYCMVNIGGLEVYWKKLGFYTLKALKHATVRISHLILSILLSPIVCKGSTSVNSYWTNSNILMLINKIRKNWCVKLTHQRISSYWGPFCFLHIYTGKPEEYIPL